ncbi:MAG: ABC transporter ATP-binding protein [Candidatus Acidulodesulfobacterium sp.]
MKLLEIKNLRKSFSDKKVLDGVNLEIKKGEISSIFGFSGEGKSTVLKIICGILKQDEGNVIIKGKIINDTESYKRHTPLVMDEPLLFPNMNVIENIKFAVKLNKSNKNTEYAKRGVDRNNKFYSPQEIMELLGITGLEKRYPYEISMGQAQRVSLARALMVNPDIILMDEPFSNLDIISKVKVRKLIKDINKELGVSILLVTHDIEDVMNLSDKMFILNDGKIQDSGCPKDVLKKPSSIDTAFLIGTENILEGVVSEIKPNGNLIKIKVQDARKKEDDNKISSNDDYNNKIGSEIIIEADFNGNFETGEHVYLAIRPEDIMILREDRGMSAGVKENRFTGKIVSSIFTSRMMEIIVESKENIKFKILIPFHAYEVMDLYEGKTVNISLKKSSIHLIKKKNNYKNEIPALI